MTGWFQGTGEIARALSAGDAWMLSEALRAPAIWPLGLMVMLLAACVFLMLYRLVPWTERNLEQTIMVVSYLAIGAIIFVEVIRRFVFNVQAPWSTTLPPYLFLLLTWIGCAYNVKLRAHLSFGEVRAMMPPTGRLALSFLDAILWYAMAVIVVVATVRLTANSASNFQLLLGTDNVMRWWFYICVPLAWLVLYARVLENLHADIRSYRFGREFGLTNELARE